MLRTHKAMIYRVKLLIACKAKSAEQIKMHGTETLKVFKRLYDLCRYKKTE